MEQNWDFQQALEYYRGQNAAQDQQILVAFLREIQTESGGLIPMDMLEALAAGLGLKPSYLSALIKRYPSLRTAEVPHRLEVCGGERCQIRGCRKLHTSIEETYRVQNGGVCKAGGFSYKVTGCMKNCPKGPSLKWDGVLYSGADAALVERLVSAPAVKKI